MFMNNEYAIDVIENNIFFKINDTKLLFNVKDCKDPIGVLSHSMDMLNCANCDHFGYKIIIFGYDNNNMSYSHNIMNIEYVSMILSLCINMLLIKWILGNRSDIVVFILLLV